ncbi:MAG: BBP7 family outer membrane beta-barrel protein [Planctomycetota bacterium]|nr:BBP7 family outer membrane beta-barrel protein [Planctomycetota bacterium]
MAADQTATPESAKRSVKQTLDKYEPKKELPIRLEVNGMAGWYSPSKNKPIVTTGNINVGLTENGALGQPGTSVLFGDDDTEFGLHGGAQFKLQAWVDSSRTWGFRAGGFVLSEGDEKFTTSSDGSAVRGLTYISQSVFLGTPDAGTEHAFNISGSFLNVFFRGPSDLSITNRTQMWGTELAAMHRMLDNEKYTLDLSFGFRHLQLEESFKLEASYIRRRHFFAGNTITTVLFRNQASLRDKYETETNFYGGQFGADFRLNLGRFAFSALPRVGLGVSNHHAHLSGHATLTDTFTGTVLATDNSGMYIHRGISGDHTEADFAVVPELETRLDIRLHKNLLFNVGGFVRYWSSVARASDQLSRKLDRRGATWSFDYDATAPLVSPKFGMQTTGLLAYGATAGFTVNW